MSFTSLLSKMFMLFCFLAVGVLCSKVGYLDDHSRQKLNKLILNICAPAMVLNAILTTESSYSVGDILTLLLDAAAFNIIMLLTALLLMLLLFRKNPARRTYQFMMSFGNSVFMGFAVMAALYGDEAVFLGSICSIPFNVLSFSVGIMIISGKAQNVRQFFKMLLNPAFIANIVAFLLFLFHVSAPAVVTDTLGYLGDMVIPLSMMVIGVSLSTMPLKSIFSDWHVYLLCVCKLFISPLVVFLVCRLFIHDTMFLNIITISAVMPTASISPILSSEYGGDVTVASKGVFITTLCSLVTVPVMRALLLV
ncbi:MAG: AEC family transporter [Oscillospiraceae bacterium]|nr:AEC family transporter [Oscillospiraceae bacterium]